MSIEWLTNFLVITLMSLDLCVIDLELLQERYNVRLVHIRLSVFIKIS